MSKKWDRQAAKAERIQATQVVLLQLQSNGICRDCRTPLKQHGYAWFYPARETGKRLQCEKCYCGYGVKPKLDPRSKRPAWAALARPKLKPELGKDYFTQLTDENGKEI